MDPKGAPLDEVTFRRQLRRVKEMLERLAPHLRGELAKACPTMSVHDRGEAPEGGYVLGLRDERSYLLAYAVACLMAVDPGAWPAGSYFATGAIDFKDGSVQAGELDRKLRYIFSVAEGPRVLAPFDCDDVEAAKPPGGARFVPIKTIGDLLEKGSPFDVHHPCSYSHLRQAASRATASTLRAMLEGGSERETWGLPPDIAVPRGSVGRLIQEFMLGDYRCFVLGGESGVGKSTFLSRLAVDRETDGDVVLFLEARELEDEPEVTKAVLASLDLRVEWQVFLDEASARFEGTERRLVVIVDGVNEHPYATRVIRSIDRLMKSLTEHRWQKWVVSMKSERYELLEPSDRFGALDARPYYRPPGRAPDGGVLPLLVELGPLEDSDVAVAYEAYRSYKSRTSGVHLFRPKTEWLQLNELGRTVAQLRQPYRMRLLMEAYNGEEIPDDIGDDEVLQLYLTRVVTPRRRQLLEDIVAAFDEAEVTELDLEGSRDLPTPRLFAAVAGHLDRQRTGRATGYSDLLELGTLRYGKNGKVRFTVERLFEYLLSIRLEERCQSADDLLRIFERGVRFKACQDAASFVLLRLIGSERGCLEFAGLVDRAEASQGAVRQGVLDCCARVLEHLALCRNPRLDVVFQAMAIDASPADVELLARVAERCEVRALLQPGLRALDVAIAEAERLGHDALVATALYWRARIHEVGGDRRAALDDYQRASKHAPEDTELHFTCRIQTAQPLSHLNCLVEAEHIYRWGIDRLRTERPGSDSLGDALRGLGVVTGRLGNRDEELVLTEEARQIHAATWNRRGLAHDVNNLAIYWRGCGLWDDAEGAYDQAEALYRAIGDREGVGTVQFNRGWNRKERGDLESARRWYESSLRIAQEIGEMYALANRVSSLAQLDEIAGRLDAAGPLYAKAVDIWSALDARNRHPSPLKPRVLGRIALRSGDVDGAMPHFLRDVEICREEKNRDRELTALHNVILVHLWRGEVSAALEIATSVLADPRLRPVVRASYLEHVVECLMLYPGAPAAMEAGACVSEHESITAAPGVDRALKRRTKTLRAWTELKTCSASVERILSVLHGARTEWQGCERHFYAEQGPASVYLEGATMLASLGELAMSAEWAERVAGSVGGRSWLPVETARLASLQQRFRA